MGVERGFSCGDPAPLSARMTQNEKALFWNELARVAIAHTHDADGLWESWRTSALATLHLSMGDLEQARDQFGASLRIRERLFGPEHPRIAASLSNLAVVQSDLSAYSEAEALYERALAIRLAEYGADHWNVARIVDAEGVVRQGPDRDT